MIQLRQLLFNFAFFHPTYNWRSTFIIKLFHKRTKLLASFFLIFRWRRPLLSEGLPDRTTEWLDWDLLTIKIVNNTSTEARLAPGIVYSVHWSTNNWQFAHRVYSVAQLGVAIFNCWLFWIRLIKKYRSGRFVRVTSGSPLGPKTK